MKFDKVGVAVLFTGWNYTCIINYDLQAVFFILYQRCYKDPGKKNMKLRRKWGLVPWQFFFLLEKKSGILNKTGKNSISVVSVIMTLVA